MKSCGSVILGSCIGISRKRRMAAWMQLVNFNELLPFFFSYLSVRISGFPSRILQTIPRLESGPTLEVPIS